MVSNKKEELKNELLQLKLKRRRRIKRVTANIAKIEFKTNNTLREVRKVSIDLIKSTNNVESENKPLIQHNDPSLPRRILGRGARMAHKKWLEENGYERD